MELEMAKNFLLATRKLGFSEILKSDRFLRKTGKHRKVYFSIYLMWLAELDCSASNFKGNFYVIFEWDDYRLKFPYEDFGASMYHVTL